jgi:hypothetical protein
MSEAVTATLAKYRSHAEPTRLWAVHWNVLNKPLGRILRRAGFVEEGLRTASEIHGRTRVLTLPAFELTRLAAAAETDRDRVLWEAAVKLGHLVAEGIAERREVMEAFARIPSGAGAVCPSETDIEAALDLGIRSPALCYLTWEAEGASDPP